MHDARRRHRTLELDARDPRKVSVEIIGSSQRASSLRPSAVILPDDIEMEAESIRLEGGGGSDDGKLMAVARECAAFTSIILSGCRISDSALHFLAQ